MSSFKDLSNKVFERLTVVELHGKDRFGNYQWLCKCECGKHKVIKGASLTSGVTKTCGNCNTFYEHPDGYMVGVTSKGVEFLFDIEDYEKVAVICWGIASRGYVSNDSKGMIHRFILGVSSELFVDHRDGNRLDNRRSNLRVATLIENNRNKGKTKSKCTSKYKGVCFDKQTSKWVSHIRVNGKTIKLGRYLIEEEAAQAYNEAAIKYFGEFARLNVLFDAGVIV